MQSVLVWYTWIQHFRQLAGKMPKMANLIDVEDGKTGGCDRPSLRLLSVFCTCVSKVPRSMAIKQTSLPPTGPVVSGLLCSLLGSKPQLVRTKNHDGT